MPGSLQAIPQYKTPDQQLHNPAALTSRGLLIGLPLLRKDALRNEIPEPHEVARARDGGFTPFSSLLGFR